MPTVGEKRPLGEMVSAGRRVRMLALAAAGGTVAGALAGLPLSAGSAALGGFVLAVALLAGLGASWSP